MERYKHGLGGPFSRRSGLPSNYSGNVDGFIGGGQLGYNFQFDRIVLGIEGDFSGSGIKGSAAFNGLVGLGGPPVPTNVVVDLSQKLEWLATIRARIGYTPFDPLLLYLTGGLAIGEVKNSMLISFTNIGPTTTYTGSASETRTGWTLGGGAEYAISRNWTTKLEYLYVDLGSGDVVIGNPSAPQPTQLTASFGNLQYRAPRPELQVLELTPTRLFGKLRAMAEVLIREKRTNLEIDEYSVRPRCLN